MRKGTENIKGKGFDVHPEHINRKGQPPKLPDLDRLMAEILGEEKDGISAATAILRAIRAKASKGDIRAAEVLLDRGYGKPKQTNDINLDGELKFNVIFKKDE